jgi:hypothetical protein
MEVRSTCCLAVSTLDRCAAAIDCTSRGYGKTIKQANEIRKKKQKKNIFFIRNRDKIKINCKKIKS